MGKIKDIIIRAEQGNEKTKLGAVMIEDASPDDDVSSTYLQAAYSVGILTDERRCWRSYKRSS